VLGAENFTRPLFGMNFSATPLLQQRLPVALPPLRRKWSKERRFQMPPCRIDHYESPAFVPSIAYP
jgi:hypothetical protein